MGVLLLVMFWEARSRMKTYAGSIQRKGRSYYFVLRHNGKQKWIALRTQRRDIARIRASTLAPADAMNERLWLQRLVALGEEANRKLHRLHMAEQLSWGNLWHHFEKHSSLSLPSASRPTYQRWMRLLEVAVGELHLKQESPVHLSRKNALRIAAWLSARYISANRMLMFYHRVWHVLSLDDGVWNAMRVSSAACAGKSREYYRRLSVQEVRRIIDFLIQTQKRDYADMVAIGFYTGLRLSDVAELERSEVSSDCSFLHIQPNKVRHSKFHLLTIPLIGRARACVHERLLILCAQAKRSSFDGERVFLFPESSRRRPSRPLSAAFRACGIMKAGNRRASFHSLRATFISLMDEKGIPPHITDAITGHAGGGMHARYTQPTPDALLDAVRHALPEL